MYGHALHKLKINLPILVHTFVPKQRIVHIITKLPSIIDQKIAGNPNIVIELLTSTNQIMASSLPCIFNLKKNCRNVTVGKNVKHKSKLNQWSTELNKLFCKSLQNCLPRSEISN